MFDPKAFRTTHMHTLNMFGPMFGPVGRGDDGERFYNEWKCRHIKDGIHLVSPKDPTMNVCFSIAPVGETLDIAFYHAHHRLVFKAIKNSNNIYDAEYRDADLRNKYLYLDLVKILKEHKLW